MRPVPNSLDPSLVALLNEMQVAITQLQNPSSPAQEFATVQAQLPPAASYKNCRVLVTDKSTIAISTLVSGAWVWLRSNGAAL